MKILETTLRETFERDHSDYMKVEIIGVLQDQYLDGTTMYVCDEDPREALKRIRKRMANMMQEVYPGPLKRCFEIMDEELAT